MFLKFCDLIKYRKLPVEEEVICQYAAYLARSRCVSTVRQYLNIIRIIHAEFGLENPLTKWQVKSVIGGIKRHKSPLLNQKQPILIEHLKALYSSLQLQHIEHLQLWAACLTAFFGLLRVGNITSRSCNDTGLSILRKDCTFTANGCLLCVRKSKTIQDQSRTHEVTLPYLPNNVLCPTSNLARFLGRSKDLPSTQPLFAVGTARKPVPLTQASFRSRLTNCFAEVGLCKDSYNTHSLRRGGATFLLASGVPVAMVKAIGDWRSDAILDYFKPTPCMKFDVIHNACKKL